MMKMTAWGDKIAISVPPVPLGGGVHGRGGKEHGYSAAVDQRYREEEGATHAVTVVNPSAEDKRHHCHWEEGGGGSNQAKVDGD